MGRDSSFFISGRGAGGFCIFLGKKKHGPLVEESVYLVTHPLVHVLFS